MPSASWKGSVGWGVPLERLETRDRRTLPRPLSSCLPPGIRRDVEPGLCGKSADSAFAAVETDPLGRPVRHLPHHDQNGRVDIPHLKSARARLSQVKWHDPKNQAAARAHLDEHWWEYQRLRARDKGLRGPVDLNSAPLEELVKLPGIG